MADLTARAISSLPTAMHELQMSGGWGAKILSALLALRAISFIPRPALCLVAGANYGLYGILIAVAGATIGASLAYWLGLTFGARCICRVRGYAKISAILDAVRSEAWRVVALLRLVPILPSSLQSFVFGISSVSFAPYCVATIVGILPGIVLEVALGALAGQGLRGDVTRWQIGLVGIEIFAGIAALTLLARRLTGEIKRDFEL